MWNSVTSVLKHNFANLENKSLNDKVLSQQAAADARTTNVMENNETTKEASKKANSAFTMIRLSSLISINNTKI